MQARVLSRLNWHGTVEFCTLTRFTFDFSLLRVSLFTVLDVVVSRRNVPCVLSMSFESLSGRRATRRGALAASVAGALGLAGVTSASAQDATPETSADAPHPMFLFVQLAEAGTWVPSAEDPEIYLLTLAGVGTQTAFFSDRPERIVGTVDTDRFLESLGFTPANPPNAAAVVRTPDGERDVLVIELFDPVYTRQFDADGGASLTYKARVLDAYQGD